MSRIRIVSTMGALFAAVVMMPAPAVADGPATGGAAVMSTAVAAPTGTAPRAYLKIDAAGGTVPGDSTDAAHLGWIEVSSFDLQRVSTAGNTTGGAGAGKVSLGEFKITKTVDKASPMLHAAVSNGVHFPTVVIELRKAAPDGSGQAYFQITLHNTMVTGYSIGQTGASDKPPTETITFNYGAIEVQYSQQKPDGSAGSYGPLKRGWDVRATTRL